jgi:hypothetical protein
LSTTIEPTAFDLLAAHTDSVPDQLSAYFLDLEGLLHRIESGTTYYQVLGVERTDGQERIRETFQQVLNLLFPPYSVGRNMPAEITPRVERAFQKTSQAFAGLASFTRRKEYDGTLLSLANNRIAAASSIASRDEQTKTPRDGADRTGSASVASEADQVNLSRIPQQGAVYRESHNARPADNRRRCERFKLSIPARITGHDRRLGKWHEMAEAIDVSRTGVKLRLRNRVKPGTVLYLTLPLPSKLRSHGFADQSFNVYTLVRRVDPPRQGVRVVSLEFIGEHPPTGFLVKPWATFRAKKWRGTERRRPDRHEHVENVIIDYFDESMHLLSREEAKTENVSHTGLRISGTNAPAEFDLVMVSCSRIKFETMAALRNRYMGTDGRERICVQLIDKVWPSR